MCTFTFFSWIYIFHSPIIFTIHSLKSCLAIYCCLIACPRRKRTYVKQSFLGNVLAQFIPKRRLKIPNNTIIANKPQKANLQTISFILLNFENKSCKQHYTLKPEHRQHIKHCHTFCYKAWFVLTILLVYRLSQP